MKIFKTDFLVNFSLFISSFLCYIFYFIANNLKEFLEKYNYYIDKNITKIFIIILFISSVTIIYNALSIFISKRVKNISILKLLGLTNKNIIFELFKTIILSLLLINILSFLISTIILKILFVIINHLIKNIIKYNFLVKINKNIFLIFIMIFIITITSLIFNIRKIIKVNPIINVNNPLKVKRTLISLNNIKNNIAYKNYKSNKRKLLPLKLGLILFFFAFIMSYLIVNYSFKIINKKLIINNYDLLLVTNGNKINYLNKFAKKNKIKKYSLFRMCEVDYNIPKEYTKQKINKMYVIYSDQEYAIGNIKKFVINDQNIKIKKNIPFGFNDISKNNILYFTNDFDEYCQNYNTYFIVEKLNFNIKKLKIKYIYQNNKLARNLIKNYKLALYIIIYFSLFIFLLVIISFILNILYSTYQNRKREYKLLHVIGLTKEEIFDISNKEIILLLIFSSFYALLLINLFNNLICKQLNIKIIHPYKEFIMLLLFTYIFLYLFVYLFNRKIWKNC